MSSRRGLRVPKQRDKLLQQVTMGKTEKSDESGKSRLKPSRVAKQREPLAERLFVDHTYNDHLHDAHECPDDSTIFDEEGICRKKGPRGGVTVTFPEKLHIMLKVCASEGLDHIVSWLPHGRCFLVHQKNEFVDTIMPRFFHQSKMTSFQRQLNLYGFVRLTAGQDRGAYYHELFLRGRPDLCTRMTRTRVKGNGMKAASSPSTEPNFWAMEPCLEADNENGNNGNNTNIPLECSSGDYENTEGPEDECPEDECMCLNEAADEPPTTSTSFTESFPSSLYLSSFGPPAVVSLPSTPQQDGKKVSVVDLPDNSCFSSTSLLDLLSSDPWKDFEIPNSGDEVFFEGLKFRYLDRTAIEDLDAIEL